MERSAGPTGTAMRAPHWCGIVGLAIALGGCFPSKTPDVRVQDLPPYTKEESVLYDDSIAPDVFDSEVSALIDERFRQRVARAELIVPVKLVAINAEKSEESVRYALVTDPAGAPFVGVVDEGPLELSVGRTSPSQAMLKALDTQLVGAKMIVLARRYQQEGKLVVHFRAEPDTLKVRAAVRAALDEQADREPEEGPMAPTKDPPSP